MNYKISEKGEIVIITPKRKMTAGPELDEMRDKIEKLIRTGTQQMVIDLGEASWMDSRGLGILVKAFSSLKSMGGELKIANIKMHIEVDLRCFPWKVYDSVEKAVKSFQVVS